MRQRRLIAALVALAAAAACAALGATEYAYSLGGTRVVFYPALFFGLVGAVQVVRLALRA